MRQVVWLEEKPQRSASNYSVTGLYFYGAQMGKQVRQLRPSPLDELEINDLIRTYLDVIFHHVDQQSSSQRYCLGESRLGLYASCAS